ncbi:MAG: hypothetical protein WHT06_04135 [Desulfobacterales bacterium]
MNPENGQSEAEMICFCFGYTRGAIAADFAANGRSRILEEILAAKRLGACRCAQANPRGT